MVDVRKVTAGDVPRVAAALGRAFLDDPVMSWLLPDRSRRAERAARWFELQMERFVLKHGQCYTTEDAAGGAVWAPPGKWLVSVGDQAKVLPQLISIFGRRIPAGFRAFNHIEKRHPKAPHFYLAVLGTEPGFDIGECRRRVAKVRLLREIAQRRARLHEYRAAVRGDGAGRRTAAVVSAQKAKSEKVRVSILGATGSVRRTRAGETIARVRYAEPVAPEVTSNDGGLFRERAWRRRGGPVGAREAGGAAAARRGARNGSVSRAARAGPRRRGRAAAARAAWRRWSTDDQ